MADGTGGLHLAYAFVCAQEEAREAAANIAQTFVDGIN